MENLTWLSTDTIALSIFILGVLLRWMYSRNRRATALTGILGVGFLFSGVGLAVGPRIESGVAKMLEEPESIELIYLEPANAERTVLNEYVVATVDHLNFRSGPGEDWEVIDQVSKGVYFPCTYCLGPMQEIAGEQGKWCQVKLEGDEVAYIWGVFLNRTGEAIHENIAYR